MFLAAMSAIGITSDAAAQVLLTPPAVLAPAPVVLVPSSFGYSRRHVAVASFYGAGYTVGAVIPISTPFPPHVFI